MGVFGGGSGASREGLGDSWVALVEVRVGKKPLRHGMAGVDRHGELEKPLDGECGAFRSVTPPQPPPPSHPPAVQQSSAEEAELNAALGIQDVVHAPRYGRVDVARSLIEQGGEVDRPDDVRAAKIEAISRVGDELESDWDSFS